MIIICCIFNTSMMTETDKKSDEAYKKNRFGEL